MRKLMTIAVLWVAAPALSIAASTPGSFESMARGQALEGPASQQRVKAHNLNYSLANSGRSVVASGLKTQPLVPATPFMANAATPTPNSFSEGTTSASVTPTASATTAPEMDPAVTSPIPEPQSYMLMLAGLVALGFMATRRGRG